MRQKGSGGQTVEGAFRSARIHSVQHMRACEQAQIRWGETSVTEIVISRAAGAAAVNVLPFTQHAERYSGADWIWWWIDANSSYGMLVQAKRLKISGSNWRFEFGYPNHTGRQRFDLITTAERLRLFPAYALYLGTGHYRGWQPCPDGHRAAGCLNCVKRSVSLLPALVADDRFVDEATITYERSVALEELWTPDRTGARVIPALYPQLAHELRSFLRTPQSGTRAVSRKMIDRVLAVRAGQFGSALADSGAVMREGDHDELGQIFPNVPADTDHSGVRYFEHTLNPLLHVPPAYALEIESGTAEAYDLASEFPETVAGVIVVRLTEND